jgi:acetyltransferase-like isoleucine patch superfamily enzyme
MIKANEIKVHPTANISSDAIIECNTFTLGKHSYIGAGVKITCNNFIAGDYLWMPGASEVGRGGCNGPSSDVTIGNSVGIFEGVVINPSESVTIGDCVGIGADCLIWSHGAWLDPLKGFPYSFESVSIGSNVWFPARSILLPGCSVGDDCVIGTGSIVTKSIPSGSLAMGSPCVVVKENYYPKVLTSEAKDSILASIIASWVKRILPHKGIEIKDWIVNDGECTIEHMDLTVTIFDTNNYVMKGEENDISEDLRDYFRRHGIRIYNGKPFKSMKPLYETTL